MSNKTIFKKIIDGEIKADVIYEDERCLAFRDVSPKAPTHVLVIPKQEIPSLREITEADESLVGHLLVICSKLAKQLSLDNGYRVVINSGDDGGQTVFHLHLHLMGGRALGWPPG